MSVSVRFSVDMDNYFDFVHHFHIYNYLRCMLFNAVFNILSFNFVSIIGYWNHTNLKDTVWSTDHYVYFSKYNLPNILSLSYSCCSRKWQDSITCQSGHSSDTAVLCAKSQTIEHLKQISWTKQFFARFEFKMSFWRISYIAEPPWYPMLSRHL